ncbi:septum site-determining protein MinC [Oceanobacillus profundus]|uniref:Probable septum site-determining protein MinC n=1 Tax=Oceanobacillus profundus TaxID=372463 RepID=A0A417YIZ2_9BACI|nr:septum site-determining protein MinC [Oceanobacillus profundus]MBR3118408.1 septum site-determining protein MinC [Oceanobacillus sp.]PAE31030.1 septum site-determining protein MinC [Paenibacillus sp. 7884-2]MCM3396976.1 septum site-determining protein MinC [Oceanobacillus profundus]MDO6448277.1 septum site-determining protein MinC [Oceanobacillus profundus]RHW33036.1 septum site-determining protein MinC [Oceanobacillus profundus]
MLDKKQIILIKGTREGLSLFIDESASFHDVIKELKDKIMASKPKENEPIVSVKVKLGNRLLNEEQEIALRNIISVDNRFEITAIESDLISREDALKWREESEIKAINRIVRSGQILEVEGDLLLVGDVNPGGKVVSTGNIYIMGNLYGIAHAGVMGDREAFITASYMKPTQLRIADYISRAPDYESDGVYMECGIIDEEQDKIIIDSLKVLSRKRKEISGFERRINNG